MSEPRFVEVVCLELEPAAGSLGGGWTPPMITIDEGLETKPAPRALAVTGSGETAPMSCRFPVTSMQGIRGKAVRPSASALFEEMPGGEALLLNRETELYHSLNPVAAAMWSALISSASTEEAVRRLLATFDVSAETLWRDLAEFIEGLRARGLVEVVDE